MIDKNNILQIIDQKIKSKNKNKTKNKNENSDLCVVCDDDLFTKEIQYLHCCDEIMCEDCNYICFSTYVIFHRKCILCGKKLFVSGSNRVASLVEEFKHNAFVKNSIYAKRALFTLYLKIGQIEEAMQIINDLIDKNDAISMYTLAAVYIDGILLPRNIQNAMDLLEKSNNLGYYRAAHTLGDLSINQDNKRAFSYYNLAYERSPSFTPAKVGLITCYLNNTTCILNMQTLNKLTEEIYTEYNAIVKRVMIDVSPDNIKNRANIWHILNTIISIEKVVQPINIYWQNLYFNSIHMDIRRLDSVDLKYLDIIKKIKSQCNKCNKSLPRLLKCSKCHIVHYCSKNCQIDDWKKHKPECEKVVESMDLACLITYKKPICL